MKTHSIIALLVAAFTTVEVSAQSTEDSRKVPEHKQTSLGLYVSAKEAYAKWKADPGKVKVLDVRTPEEYTFVGHAEMARNIPLITVVYQWNEEKDHYVMIPNPGFVAKVKEWAKPTDTILVMCRSGDRSKVAVDKLAKAGFTNAFTVVDGVEGDKVNDPGNVYHGKRMKNGWKNSALPWTYEVDLGLAWLSDR